MSKPIVPPWHDGSKNLVRDIATHLTRAKPTVLTTPGAVSLGERVQSEPVYRDAGRFSPAAFANARVMRRLLTGDPHDIWHFVFAPNPASSMAAAIAKRARSLTGWRGKVVQTVASAPRDFGMMPRLVFGDVVVALSDWTRGQLLGSGVNGRLLRMIPPCVARPRAPTSDERKAVRVRFNLGDGPIVLYPGDYEVSRGAQTVAEAVSRIARKIPEARVVFACRPKTKGAAEAGHTIRVALDEAGLLQHTRDLGEIDDMPALLAESSVVVFPVDDLYGKVDIPLVLLEALALAVPLVVARGGPLETLECAKLVDPGDGVGLSAEVLAILGSSAVAGELGAHGLALYERRFRPAVAAEAYDDLYDELVRQRV